MDAIPKADWFELREARRRRFSNSVWVPLRQEEYLYEEGPEYKVGRREEFLGVNAIAFYTEHRATAEKLDWTSIGVGHSAEPHAFKDGRYKPVDTYMYDETDVIGVELVFTPRLNGDHEAPWILNPDLVIALRLLQEGDSWLCVTEGYVEVVRARRDSKHQIVAIEIKAEFLRDYLAARGLALRLSQYRQRMAIVEDATHITWNREGLEEGAKDEQFSARVFKTDVSGELFGGGTVAVFQSWRTDVDNEEDVPVYGRESDSNTDGRAWEFKQPSQQAFRVEGELWRQEWIEPAAKSIRVRGDRPDEELFFAVDAGGARLPASELDHEDVGRYLWFRPAVIGSLLAYRGARLSWYTAQTGSISCSPGSPTHFGVNREGLITVYACDVAKRPQWQQRVWNGHNITPEGAVCAELLDAQQRAKPADTTAPEEQFERAREILNHGFSKLFGQPLFRPHESEAALLKKVHRFRALEQDGVLALAKDIARLTADSIDAGVLRMLVAPGSAERWGSLKHLQHALTTVTDEATARATLTPLVGIYELRLGDAHLPSSKLSDAYDLVGLDPKAPPLEQGFALIQAAAEALRRTCSLLAITTEE